MEEQITDGETKFSKYNAGVAIQMRLDGLWKEANSFVLNEQYYKWNTVLDRIWSELARDIKVDEFKDKIKNNIVEIKGYGNQYKEFDEELLKLGKIVDTEPEGFKKITQNDLDKRRKQYSILMNKEIFLRRLENHLGKGTAWDDHDEDDF